MAEKKSGIVKKAGKKRECSIPENGEMTLAQLPVGMQATIEKILPDLRDRKKFADVGLVAGVTLEMEGHAPFGGLLRVKLLETSIALHRDDAAKIILKKS